MPVSSSPPPEPIQTRLAAIRERIAAAAVAAGRDPASIELMAVSKMQPDARIDAMLGAGVRLFGENRVQEAVARWESRRAAHADLELHLIGPLQTNKVRQAVALFDVIETVDRPRLAEALGQEMARAGRTLDCFVQVNTGAEPQKAGVMPDQADAFIAACRADYGLRVVGLMCIPPAEEEPSLHFAFLREIARRHGLAFLSMGMSDDFETAIRFGSTHVRVGTALFGARSAP